MGMWLATSTAWPEGRRGRSGIIFDTVSRRGERLLRQLIAELTEGRADSDTRTRRLVCIPSRADILLYYANLDAFLRRMDVHLLWVRLSSRLH